MSYLPSIYLLWLSVCSNLLCIYLFSCCFLIIESREFFIYSIYMSLIRYIVCKFFLLLCSLSFHSLNSVSWRGEFWWSLIYQDFLLWIMLFMLCLKRLCFNSRLKNFLFSFRISSFRFSIIFRSTSMRLMFIYGVKYDLEVHLFASRYPVIPVPCIEKPILSPVNSLHICQKSIGHIWTYFWSIYSVPRNHLSIFMPTLLWFD